MASSQSFLEVTKARRSHYALTDKAPISDDKIIDLVNQTQLHVPSAFNIQTVRAVVLLGEHHKRFWQVTLDTQEAHATDKEQFARGKGRIEGFKAGYGTILFLDDQKTLKEAQAQFAAYAPLFIEWSAHSQGMHQFVLWAALEAEGFGANLQHLNYDPNVVTAWKKEFNISEDWTPYAQLVFGGRADPNEPPAKDKKPLSETVKVFK